MPMRLVPEVKLLQAPISHPPMWQKSRVNHRVQQPLCLERVHVAEERLATTQRRKFKTQSLGIELDQCGAPATHRVGRKPMCRTHAGRYLLELLEK